LKLTTLNLSLPTVAAEKARRNRLNCSACSLSWR